MKKQIFKYIKIFLGISIFVTGMLSGLFFFYSRELPPMAEVQSYQVNSGSEVYDCKGKLIHIFAVENRKLTTFDNLPPHLISALLVIEDMNFYNHWGIDIYGLFRAIIVDIITWDFAQGGSTITQQLARNMFLNLDKQLPRKIKEAMLAVLIERNFTKEEILEIYFNKIYFGGGIYGIETAAYRYFGKTTKDLTIGEAALLVGMIQRPNYYSPVKKPDKSIQRRNFVLSKLYENGYLTSIQYENALNEKLTLNQHRFVTNSNSNYFIDYIRIRLERKYGTEQVFNGGLKIYTTLDNELQLFADSTLNEHLSSMELNRNYKEKYKDFPPTVSNIKANYIQGGVFAIDPETGYVKVMIGGRNFRHSKFNRMTQAKRQAGSAFKPLLYTAAVEKGYTPATIINDAPVTFMKEGQVYWEPKNYEKNYYGNVTLRNALKKSMNVSAAKLIYDVGPQNVVKIAENFGLTTPIPPFMSLSVGSCEVIPYELISSFSIYASGGERVTPIFYTKVTDHKGKVLEENKPDKVKVLDPKVAWIMTDLMKTVVNHGTAFPIRSWGFTYPCAGKTGTTDDYRDAWFIGYTPKLVLGVWTGFDNNQPMGSGMTGATATLPVWIPIAKKAVYEQLKAGEDVDADFVKPEGIVEANVSSVTGFLAKNSYGPVIKEYFIKGTEPGNYSDSLKFNYYPSRLRPGRDRYLNVVEVKD
ncbi:MAG TPA: PBP1A family penicillin-binding protein [Candidatus Cloacimonadota bacterium]|nr:PBP1A family penicillin-binding protein [Candidatus Cloacimonadota bacterium]